MATPSDQDWQLTKKTVLERNCHMFNNPLMSDITFTCGESKRKYFYAHKYVLATSSPVFYAMFYGDLAEKNSVIHLEDADEESLEMFLRFLYTEEYSTTPENALNVMYLAKKYMVPLLVDKSVEILIDGIEPDNVLPILESATQFSISDLEKKCWQVVDLHTQISIESSHFLDINKSTLGELLKRDTLKISEVQLFHWVLKWSDNQCELNGVSETQENRRSFLGDLVYQLRFLVMSKSEFTNKIVPAGLLTEEEVTPILRRFEEQDPEGEPLLWNITKQRAYFIRVICVIISMKSARPSWTNELLSWISQKVDDDRGDNWRFKISNTSYLRFKVDTPAMLHGLRLLGNPDDGEHKVAIEIEGLERCINGKYKSTFDELSASYGFDVMLPTPLRVDPNKFIGVSASIRKSQSYYVISKLDSSIAGGLTVVFEHQYTKGGDIAEIILRHATN